MLEILTSTNGISHKAHAKLKQRPRKIYSMLCCNTLITYCKYISIPSHDISFCLGMKKKTIKKLIICFFDEYFSRPTARAAVFNRLAD